MTELKVVPTFEVGNGRSGTWTPDRCSEHGDIPTTVSIVEHLESVHGLPYDMWRALGGRDDLDDELSVDVFTASRNEEDNVLQATAKWFIIGGFVGFIIGALATRPL